MKIKLSEWAKNQGIKYQTAWKWFKDGQIENAHKSKSGSIFVEDDQELGLKIKLMHYQKLYEDALNRETTLKLQLLKYQQQQAKQNKG